jgi:hypothetical protein
MTLLRREMFHSDNGREINAVYLSRKSLSTKEMYLDIVHTIGPDAMDYSTMKLDLRHAHCPCPIDLAVVPDQEHDPHDSDQAILALLSKQLFASVRELSHVTSVSKLMVHWLCT